MLCLRCQVHTSIRFKTCMHDLQVFCNQRLNHPLLGFIEHLSTCGARSVLDGSLNQLPFTMATSDGLLKTLQVTRWTNRSPWPCNLSVARPILLLLLLLPLLLWSNFWHQFIDVSMDHHHPHLIGDCLIHIFTFLNEEDLILASSVCKVGSVQLAEVGCIQNNTKNPADNLFNNYLFLGLARSRRDSLVVEVGCVCTFSIWCTFRSKRSCQPPLPWSAPGGCVCSAGVSATLPSWAETMWVTRGRNISCDVPTWKPRWRQDGREVTPAKASEDTRVRRRCCFVCHVFFMSDICCPTNRQGCGFGVPAGGFSAASSALEHLRDSVQRLDGWYSQSMEHPKRTCMSQDGHV